MTTPKITKPTKKQVKHFLFYAMIVVVGNAIAASASAFFIEPNNLTMGGTTGIGILISHYWDNDFAVSLVVYMLNFVLFVIGAIFLGKKFALATLAGTVLYPSFMSLWTWVNNLYLAAHDGIPIAHDDPLLAAIIGSLLFGFGIGIVVRVGASTGGTDIPALIFHKYFNLPVSIGLWACDIIVIAIQLISASLEAVLYGVVLLCLSSLIIDLVSPIGLRKRKVEIISKKYKDVRDMILNKLNRGVTLYVAETGFLREKTYVLMTVVSNRDVVKLKNEVEKIDPEAFLMVSDISEVSGRGFSTEKIVLPRSQEKDDPAE